MRHQTNERWFQLCQLASIEKDPAKLLLLVTEINRILEEKEERLKQRRRGAGVIHPYKPR